MAGEDTVKILITGACGYVGSSIARCFAEAGGAVELVGIDNLMRRGSESNIDDLRRLGMTVAHGDIRAPEDLAALPAVDWVIDCAANPSVLAGTGLPGTASPEQLVRHNLVGTVNVLEYCRRHRAGLVMLSTSRVYALEALRRLPLEELSTRFEIKHSTVPSAGISPRGIAEEFSTESPVSLYGATKRASEILALEYASAFDLPLWVNRCGVIGGPGQFGKPDQGIVSYWIYAWLLDKPLKYIGFGGTGKQVRDVVHADDVARLVLQQIRENTAGGTRLFNVGGGAASAWSLQELSAFCRERFKKDKQISSDAHDRPGDIPYFVTDSARVREQFTWAPAHTGNALLEEIARWAENNVGRLAELAQSWR